MPYFNVQFVAPYFSMVVGAWGKDSEEATLKATECIRHQYGWDLSAVIDEVYVEEIELGLV